MLCFERGDDDKLARGWPNLVVAVDGHKSDKSPAKSAMNALRVCDPIYFTEWPRETLHRYLRATLATGVKNTDVKLFDVAGAPSAEEVRSGLRKLVAQRDWSYPFRIREIVYGAETIIGTDATIEAIVATLRNYAPTHGGILCATSAVTTLPFLFLRGAPSVVVDARAKLATFRARVDGNFNELQVALDVVLHGAPAVRAAMGKFVYLETAALGTIASLEDAGDDPDMVRELVPKADKKASMSVRIVAIGGTSVLANIEKRKWRAAQMPSVVRDFGMIRAPEIVDLMLSLVGKSSVKDAPLAWFQSHADYAKPILERAKSDSAKAILRQLA